MENQDKRTIALNILRKRGLEYYEKHKESIDKIVRDKLIDKTK
jgi:hypothetical protein